MSTAVQNVATPTELFESMYAQARATHTSVPWSDGRPHSALVTWLNAVAPSLIRSGARVAVVGSGLGEDARELIRRGYEVTAFDCSETAIAWARELDTLNASRYQVADLFNVPPRWRRRFDLVVEINTIQSLPPDMHAAALEAMAELPSPHGYLLVICHHSDEPVEISSGAPWALTEAELKQAASSAGLVPEGTVAIFADDRTPPVTRIRALFRRG